LEDKTRALLLAAEKTVFPSHNKLKRVKTVVFMNAMGIGHNTPADIQTLCQMRLELTEVQDGTDGK